MLLCFDNYLLYLQQQIYGQLLKSRTQETTDASKYFSGISNVTLRYRLFVTDFDFEISWVGFYLLLSF